MTERLGVAKNVRAEKHRPPLVPEFEDQRTHVAAAQGVEPRHRLVEKDHVGIVQQRLRDADALDHALGKLAELHPALGAEADAIEQCAYARPAIGGGVSEELRKVMQQLFGGEVIVKIGVLGKVADPLPGLEISRRTAEDLGAAGGRKDELHQQLQRRGLAGAVGAQEAEDLPLLDVECEPVERAIRPAAPEADRIVLGELLDADGWRHGVRARQAVT